MQALLHRAATQRPLGIFKYAMTLDGKIATSMGHSAWVSSSISRQQVFENRARSDAVIVGGQTVRLDNPRLTTRREGGHMPMRICMSRTLDLQEVGYCDTPRSKLQWHLQALLIPPGLLQSVHNSMSCAGLAKSEALLLLQVGGLLFYLKVPDDVSGVGAPLYVWKCESQPVLQDANLWDVSVAPTVVMTQRGARTDFQRKLRARGVEVVEFDFLTPHAVAAYCYDRGFLQCLWECGGTLSAPAIAAGVIHKTLAFIAPKLVSAMNITTSASAPAHTLSCFTWMSGSVQLSN